MASLAPQAAPLLLRLRLFGGACLALGLSALAGAAWPGRLAQPPMILVPAGSYQPAAAPRRAVSAFLLAAEPSQPGDDPPTVYCDRLTAAAQRRGLVLTPCYLGRPTAQPGCTGFRLPTVDEWAYAARPDFPAPNTAPLLEGQPPSAAPLYVARTAAP